MKRCRPWEKAHGQQADVSWVIDLQNRIIKFQQSELFER
jgi:hypothetical protein